MYFWQTKKLANAIKTCSLSEQDKKNYYIGSSAITLITMYIAIIGGTENMYLTIAVGAVTFIVMVFGINLTFKTNGGNEGKDYIARVVILSFPLLIKIYLYAVIATIILGILGTMIFGIRTSLNEWINLLISVAVQVIFFWRLNVHLTAINTESGNLAN
jgi:hypothetical protein